MKTPPFLMAACLLFWGWQSDLLAAAAIMGLVLESSRYIQRHWEVTDADVTRIWHFCALLALAVAGFAFTSNQGPATFGQMFENPNLQSTRNAGNAGTQAASAFIRWLPFVFYLFAVAQAFSPRREFPLETISAYQRYRRKQLLKRRAPAPKFYHYNVSYPYFVFCLFAASAHSSTDDRSFFWGLCVLVAWALWSQRPKGLWVPVWLAILTSVIIASFFGEHGLTSLSRLTDWADNYNPQWLAHWMRPHTDPEQSRTSIGQIGQLKMSAQIIARVTPINNSRVPTYLREATYRKYEASGANHPIQAAVWYSGGTKNDFSTLLETPINSGRWSFQSGPPGHSLVNISCYLEDFNNKDGFARGVLPLPVDCDHLEDSPTYIVKINSVGTVLAEGPSFLSFNAGYGSGVPPDSAPAIGGPTGTDNVGDDLLVPDQEKPALDEVISNLHLEGQDDAKKIIAVSHYFAANYNYSFWQEKSSFTGTNQTALANFLLHTHHGHCEFFATATVLLLRELHIPARYAVGYVVHEPAGGHYVVRLRDAHAWCLAWNSRDHAWQNLDTTPASWMEMEGSRTSRWQFVSDFFSWLHFKFAQFRYGQSHLRPYLLIAMVPVLGYFLYLIVFNRRKHKPQVPAAVASRLIWPGHDSEFYQLEISLSKRGLARRPDESLVVWLRQVAADPMVAEIKEPLQQLLRLHYRHRFDPLGLSPSERENLSHQARACLAKIAKP